MTKILLLCLKNGPRPVPKSAFEQLFKFRFWHLVRTCHEGLAKNRRLNTQNSRRPTSSKLRKIQIRTSKLVRKRRRERRLADEDAGAEEDADGELYFLLKLRRDNLFVLNLTLPGKVIN
jgi:hypothetical protein